MVDVETSLMSAYRTMANSSKDRLAERRPSASYIQAWRPGKGTSSKSSGEDANNIAFIRIYKSLNSECPMCAHGPTPVMRRTPTTMASKMCVYIL